MSGKSMIDISWKNSYHMLMPADPDKDVKSRLTYYIDWLAMHRRMWYRPALDAYRDYLLYERVRVDKRTGGVHPATLTPRSVQAHLATIRARYEALLRDNNLRNILYALAPAETGMAGRKSFVDEVLIQLENAIHPRHSQVKLLSIQDETDSAQLRLTKDQVRDLLREPGIGSLPALRDTAMIAVMVCTGIREAELCNLRVEDMRQTLGGELALRVRAGKNYKQRLVPYGPLDWCLTYVDRWLSGAQISSGYVFRGFYKGYKRVRPTGISTRAVNLILNQYPIMISGEMRDVKPHDLRRTYARSAYEHGMDIERIRQNLGHVKMETTLGYIGQLSGEQRRPPSMFTKPYTHSELRRVWEEAE